MFRAVPLSIIRSVSLYTQQWYMSYRFADILLASCQQTCMTYTIAVCTVKKSRDEGQRNCPKYVEFYSKNKFEKLVHLVGFIIRIKWSHIFHNKGLTSYPVLRKGQYHIPKRAKNCLVWEGFAADMSWRIFKTACHLSTEGRKISLYKNAGLYNSVHLLNNKIFAVQFSSATCLFRLLRSSVNSILTY